MLNIINDSVYSTHKNEKSMSTLNNYFGCLPRGFPVVPFLFFLAAPFVSSACFKI